MNERVNNLKASATLALNQKAKKLAAAGEDIINLTAGEPDFKTAKNIQKAAIAAVESGKHFYTAASGISELKQAVADSSNRFYGQSFEARHVIVSNGGKQALFNSLYSILNEGDEVVIFKPFWVSYPAILGLCGAKAVYVDSHFDNHFVPSIDDFESALTSKTKAVIFNSPNNPSSQLYPKSFVETCLNILKTKHPEVYAITDDIYARLIYPVSSFFSAAMSDDFPLDKLIVINGLSKTYAMTGWRVGWAIANESLITQMNKIQSQTTSNVCSIAQWAAVEALSGDQSETNAMLDVFKNRRDICLKAMNDFKQFEVKSAQGGFYFFIKVTDIMDRLGIESDIELSNMLLQQVKLAMVPGSAFGKNGYLRMSFACHEDIALEGISRLASI